MNKILKSVLLCLFNKKYIGKKHTPEEKLIKSKTKWANDKDVNSFKKEYKNYINERFILRNKKKTKKSSDWHISLNPRKLKKLFKMLK